MPRRTRVPSLTSEATTRTTTSFHIPARNARQLPLPSENITSPETGLGYTIERTSPAAWDDHDDAMVATEVLLASRLWHSENVHIVVIVVAVVIVSPSP